MLYDEGPGLLVLGHIKAVDFLHVWPSPLSSLYHFFPIRMKSISHVISLIFFLLTLESFVYAAPVDSSAAKVSKRDCPTVGCNEVAVYKVVEPLKSSIMSDISFLGQQPL
jgi:hypothetical protein